MPHNSKTGFTLVELVVSMTISMLIIGSASYFIFKTNSEAQTAKNRTKIHTEMSSFIEKMSYLRGKYASGSILIDTPSNYDILLLSNSGSTSGVLIGVVNLGLTDTNGGVKLDPVSSFTTYGNKAIGIQELSNTQLTSLLTTPANAYNITFQSDRYFSALQTENFSAIIYNSGGLIELNIGIYERLLDGLLGQENTTVSNETILPFNLVF